MEKVGEMTATARLENLGYPLAADGREILQSFHLKVDSARAFQVLLLMGQDFLSKEEVGNLLYQRVYVLTSTQYLRHSTRNFSKLAGDYLGG